MGESLRQTMTYIHTWLGLVLGFVLIAVFFFGSLSVFDREIDRWSVPETRAPAAPLPSFDRELAPLIAGVRPDSESVEYVAGEVVGVLPPTDSLNASGVYVGTGHRDPLITMYVDFDIPNQPRDPLLDHIDAFGGASSSSSSRSASTGLGSEARSTSTTSPGFLPCPFSLCSPSRTC